MWDLISTSELERYLDEGQNMLLVDLRSRDAFCRGHIRGAVNIPYDELDEHLPELRSDQMIVLYCYHGSHSIVAARDLALMGYRVTNVYGGILAYRGKYFV